MQVSGVGEILDPVPRLPAVWMVLVNPGVAVATRDVFAARTGDFSSPAPIGPVPPGAAALAQVLADRHNDLEAPAIRLAPAIGSVLDALRAAPGCLLARMSGSGATCFGLFSDPKAAQARAQAIGRTHPAWWSVAAPLRQ
jgi:4-diphosphocytidyl-2-C-methyl-D-erythritol kinase